MIDLWLDDVRPAPDGWHHVLTADAAKVLLRSGEVRRASLDHDLGDGAPHGGEDTGYMLVCWMEETGHWPTEKPTVHSANPVGRERMRRVIDASWKPRNQENDK